MRTASEIWDMAERLDSNIWAHGWDASVEGAYQALRWVLGADLGPEHLEQFMSRPDVERRREWIARGGDPAHWPDKPEATNATAD